MYHLTGTDGTSAEAEGRDVRMPPTARRVEEGVSAKVAAAAVLGRGAAGGAAGALLYDGAGAVGGWADYRLALHSPLLTAVKQGITRLSSHGRWITSRKTKQSSTFLEKLENISPSLILSLYLHTLHCS